MKWFSKTVIELLLAGVVAIGVAVGIYLLLKYYFGVDVGI